MKKILMGILLGSIILTGFTACTFKPKPDKAVSVFLDAIKEKKLIDYAKLFDGEVTLLDTDPLNTMDTPTEISTRAETLLLDFDYEIVKSVVAKDGLSAVVTVKFTTVNMGYIFQKFFMSYLTKAMEAAFKGATTAELNQLGIDLFMEATTNVTKDKLTSVDIQMIFKDKVWLIAGGEVNKKMFDALTGGLLSTIEALQPKENVPTAN